MDRPRKQILNRSVNCLIVSRKGNKVAMRKLGTIVFALFSVAVAVFNLSLCRLSLFFCPISLFQGHFALVSKFSPTGLPLHEKLLQFDWLRAVVFQLNLKYLHVKIT